MSYPPDPSSTVTIKFCPECSRTDRFIKLDPKHYHKGKKCLGSIYTATYRLDRLSVKKL